MEAMLIAILQGLGLDPNELKAKAEEFIGTVKSIDNRIKNIENALGLGEMKTIADESVTDEELFKQD